MQKTGYYSFIIVLLVLLLTSCMSQKRIESGRAFDFNIGRGGTGFNIGVAQERLSETKDRISSDHSFLIHFAGLDFIIGTLPIPISLAEELTLTLDGKLLENMEFTVLEAGSHTIYWRYQDNNAKNAGRTYFQEGGSLTFDFEPGNYYYFSGTETLNNFSVSIINLTDGNNVNLIAGYRSITVPATSVIDGINASVRRSLRIEYP
ncbi:MAG: hypothetical protein FWG89_09795 [Treponema sp.]|nr:hypothetical protein [Treponema sp.]